VKQAFVAGVPAFNFSRNNGIAGFPNAGVAIRHFLIMIVSTDMRLVKKFQSHLSDCFKSSEVIPYGSSGGGLNVMGK